MFWKFSSESDCFCLKPTTPRTFIERILCSIICVNVYDVLKNFFWKPLLLLEAHHSLYFHRAPTLFNCMFGCVKCFEKLLLETIASAWSPPLSVLSESAYFVQLYVWMCIILWRTSHASLCFCLKSKNQCTFTELIIWSIVCLNFYNVLKKFSRNPLLLLEAHHSLYIHRAHTSFNCMFECVYCFEEIHVKAIASAWSPPLSVLSQTAYFVQLYVWLCLIIWNFFSASHCFCLKPITQCNFKERILCSIVCLNVYNVLKNFFWRPLLLLEARPSVYFHRAHTLFNCIIECV